MVSSPKDYQSDNHSIVQYKHSPNLEKKTLCFYVVCFLMISFNPPDQLSHNHGAVLKPVKLGTIKLHIVHNKNSWTAPSIKLDKCHIFRSEAESKEKHGVWDPMPELTITSPSAHSRADSNTFTMDNPMPEST